MEVYLNKSSGKITAADEHEKQQLSRLANGMYKVEFKQARNYKFHKKFFALLNFVFDHQSRYTSLEPMRAEIIMRTGRFVAHHHLSGSVSYRPQSIAFANMSEEDFQCLVSDCINVILKHFCDNMTEDQLWQVTRF